MANSLPAVLTSLTFKAVDIQRSNLSLHLDVIQGLNDGLDVRGEDTVIPSASGRIARNRKGDVRHILLAGILQGVGSTEAVRLGSWQDLRDEVEALFDPTDAPGTIVGKANDGSWRSITARTTTIVWNPGAFGMDQLSIAMDSVDPDWLKTGDGS